MDPAALPDRAQHHGADGGDQAGVVVGDHQLHSVQAALAQAAQEPVQNSLDSLSPTLEPSTSRRPSALTPLAITTAWETTRPLTRALQ